MSLKSAVKLPTDPKNQLVTYLCEIISVSNSELGSLQGDKSNRRITIISICNKLIFAINSAEDVMIYLKNTIISTHIAISTLTKDDLIKAKLTLTIMMLLRDKLSPTVGARINFPIKCLFERVRGNYYKFIDTQNPFIAYFQELISLQFQLELFLDRESGPMRTAHIRTQNYKAIVHELLEMVNNNAKLVTLNHVIDLKNQFAALREKEIEYIKKRALLDKIKILAELEVKAKEFVQKQPPPQQQPPPQEQECSSQFMDTILDPTPIYVPGYKINTFHIPPHLLSLQQVAIELFPELEGVFDKDVTLRL